MFWKKNKELILVVGFLIFLGVLHYFGVRSILEAIRGEKSKMEEIAAIQENQRKRLGQLPSLRRDYEFVLVNEPKIPMLLDKSKVVELFQEIERIASETGNKAEKSVVDPPDIFPAKSKNAPKEGGGLASKLPSKEVVQLKIDLVGNFKSVKNFINKVENGKYFSDILSLELKAVPPSASLRAKASAGPSGGSEKNILPEVPQEEEIKATLNLVIYTQN